MKGFVVGLALQVIEDRQSVRELFMISSPTEKLASPAVSTRHHELAGIELLRFLSAFAILIWHYQHFFFVGEYDGAIVVTIQPSFPFYSVLRYPYEYGYIAVDVFWVISGFIFYWRYAQPVYVRRVAIFEFATRRFSRLYPLHVVTLTIVALLQYIYFQTHGGYFIYNDNSASSFIAQLFFASNWFNWQTLSFNGSIWSISVEILIYFLFFWIVRTAGAVVIIAIGASGLSFLLMRYHFSFFVLNGSLFVCSFFFFVGGFTCWLYKQSLTLIVALLCTGALIVARHHHFHSIFVVSVVFLVVIFARLSEVKFGSILSRTAFLGNATYSSYLVHFPLQLGLVTMLDAMGYSRTVFLNPIAFLVYLALVIGVSLTVYHLFELPSQNWIRRRLNRAKGHFQQVIALSNDPRSLPLVLNPSWS